MPDILATNLQKFQLSAANAELVLAASGAGCHLETSADAGPQLVVNGIAVYPATGAAEIVAGQMVQLLGAQNPAVVVFFGFGLGWHAQALRRLSRVPLVVYEPSVEALHLVLSRHEFDLPEVYLVTDEAAFVERLASLMPPGEPSVLAGAIPAYGELFPAPLATFKQAAIQIIDKCTGDRLTRARFAESWLSHTAANIGRLGCRPAFAVLTEVFAGKPGIFVGAGPSLDANIETLATLQGRALIIAVHTAVIPLARAGVIPDLVVILESQELLHYFAGVDTLDQMVLLPAVHTHPLHLDLGFRDILSIAVEGHTASDWLQQAYGDPIVPSGGSVACAAFSILHALGCDPLVAVGMDLAYTGNRRHVRHSETGCCETHFDAETGVVAISCRDGVHEPSSFRGARVEAWGGGEVITRQVLTDFRYWFEAAARSWAGSRQLINATEGGARIHGFSEMTLAAVAAAYCADELPAKDLIGGVLADQPSRPAEPLAQTIAAELEIVASCGAIASNVAVLAENILESLRLGRSPEADRLLVDLEAIESTMRAVSRQTRLLNTLAGYRIQNLAGQGPGKGPTSQGSTDLPSSVALRQQIANVIAEAAVELAALYDPVVAALSADGQTP